MSDFIFVKDKFNKYSIRALISSFERHFHFDYKLLNIEEIENYNVKGKLIFFSFNTFNKEKYYFLSKKIKDKGAITVCGGPHPTAKPSECIKYFDAVCIGEGEEIIKDVVEDFLDGALKKIYENFGLVNIDDYPSFPKKEKMFGPIEITRGCFFRCKYCQTPNLFDRKVRHKDLSRIFEDVEYAYKNNKTDFRFITPDAAIYQYNKGVNLEAIKELFEGIKKITKYDGRIFFGSFPSEINPYHVSRELIELMKSYCSNTRVVIGLQTASERLLSIINRPTDLAKVESVINDFLQFGFGVDVDFIFGLPFEEEKDVIESIKWIEKWNDRVRIHAHYFMPLPGTEFENEMPSQLSERSLLKLKSLEGEGKIFGQWVRQMDYSKKLVEI
ncbi:TIGR04013 family B12-binding domain/radical SAM domain-containing protein [Deferribacter autotrophicus]|uniref:TIGR04013 family B12-binding domain/radical SAM domain-containing protein n=1 Tax=Deferribacter autotrophicus TaxID=500465 RepID=A0A5A8F895_9BACT|nr:TIGR04013 family B12-binding domain/radical SAM domain-containing protein [Deferribacter autotrophicus]KAA0259488.1 TIGR04013 family B12-binding domain/radical SAM domain-containing protein [Deferribacter autotrophicus]